MPPSLKTLTKYARRLPAKLASSEDPRLRRVYVTARQAARHTVNTVTSMQLGWVGNLHAARWVEPGRFQFTGWAYERGYGHETPPQIRVRLRAPGVRPVEADVSTYPEPLANARLKEAKEDFTLTGFTAEVDPADLLATGRPTNWTVEVEVVGADGHRARGRFNRRTSLSSAFSLMPRTFDDGVQVLPFWDGTHGLRFRVARPAVRAEAIEVAGRRVSAELVCAGVEFNAAELESPRGSVLMAATRLPGGRVRVSAVLPPIDPAAPSSLSDPDDDEGLFTAEPGEHVLPVLTHRLVVTDRRGRRHQAASTQDPMATPAWPDRPPFAYAGPGGTVRIRDTEAMMMVTQLEVESSPVPGVRVRGVVLGDLPEPRLSLVGARASRQMTVTINPDHTFEAFGSWLSSNWGWPDLPPMSGRYTLRGETGDGRWFRIAASTPVVAEAPRRLILPLFTCHVGVASGRRLAFTLSAPQTAGEFGSYNQRRLASIYQSRGTKLKHQFYFESFGGRQANCNPRALDRELASRHPDIPRYWGVVDASVPVPEGATPVVQGTEAWWAARQTSRFVITNEWLRRSFQHLPGQFVLQTWHGTMLKRIGLDRPTMDLLMRRGLLRERSNWDLLLSQNPHSTKILRSAYDWDKPIWEEGYPRNDQLLTVPREPIRRMLGIREDQVAVLYAPTWREDRTEMVTFLDVERLMADLGDHYVLLLRGHSRTMDFGADLQYPGVIDVTSYPDVADIFLAADAMITDYSSVMFDFSVTGRPMIFFVPDLDQYRDSLRGLYFDLGDTAPGPVLATQGEVTGAVLSLDADRDRYAGLYRAWQERFNPYDDGQVSARVIDRLLAEGA